MGCRQHAFIELLLHASDPASRIYDFFCFKRYKMGKTSMEDIQRRLIELEVEHRDLDAVIDMMARDTLHEELQLRRLKKRKLQLKDHITLLKMQLIPDIPA